MPTPLRRRLRLTRRCLISAIALVVVALALLLGAASQVLPLAERHPERIADWLSERAGRPVRFDRIDSRWTRRGPLLRLHGLRIGTGDAVRVGEAEVLLAIYSGLLPGRSLTELRLRGLVLTLRRDDEGAWSVLGLPDGGGGDPLEVLRRLGEVQVIGGRLRVQAPSLGVDATLPRIDLRLRVEGTRLRIGSRAWIDPAYAPLQAVIDFERRRGDGQIYLRGEPADLTAWSALLRVGGVQLREGQGALRAWLQVQAHRVAGVRIEADLRRLAWAGAPLLPSSRPPSLNWQRLRLRARWQLNGHDWRLDVPQLQIDDANGSQVLDGLAVAGGARVGAASGPLDVSPLLAVLALSDRPPLALRRWLLAAQPRLRLQTLRVAGRRDGPLQVQGQLAALAFAPVGSAPGLSGLRGRFDGDARALALRFDPTARLRLNWPSGFGVVHELQLAGTLVGWRREQDWQVATPALRVQAADYGAELRGGLAWQGDGSRPHIDLAAQLDPVALPVAKKFWIRSSMSKAAIDWLDNALVGGTLRNGIGLVSGDLDDWPFGNGNGRFEARGQIENGVLRFQRDWPAIERLAADVAFIGSGFQVQGKGDLAGVAVESLDAGIDDFKVAELQVRAHSRSHTTALLALLRRSPLQRTLGDTLTSLTLAGPARTGFELRLPLLGDGQSGQMRGQVELDGVTVTDSRWQLAFSQVRGTVNYDDDGFAAENLSVLHQGQPGRLSLRAGGAVRDPQQAFEAMLGGNVDVAELFNRAPQMEWLRPFVHGRSYWRVGVELPKTGAGRSEQPSHLSLDSDLVGTALELPAPLDKAPATPLAAHVDVALPFGDGDIDVVLGRRVAIKAASHGQNTGVRVVMGSDSVRERPPAQGLVVGGRATSLDALDWIGLVRSSGGGEATAMPLQQIDLQVDRLLMLGGVFPDTRLRLRPVAGATAVTLDGAALSGSLNVPDAAGAEVRGQLRAVHWRPALPAPASTDAVNAGAVATMPVVLPEPARQAVAEFDPAAIPPLALDVADLRVGDGRFGSAMLRTRRLTDGIQVDQLQLRSDTQNIAVTGAWRGKGEAATTRLSARADSRDLGQLLQDLTLGGQLRGGEGEIELNAGWSGAPTAFQLASLQGNLKAEARNGQLLEVEPGAGRVLGLLSVAQLPRRLMLDFRDFFSKGLAFNRTGGEIRFGDGIARTDDIRIEGPAATINLRGQADLRQQTYDQTVEVNPKSGNLLTVVGAVAGGPVGAAVGAAANAVLGKPLGAIGARTYHVSGPWKEPKIEVVERTDDSVHDGGNDRGG